MIYGSILQSWKYPTASVYTVSTRRPTTGQSSILRNYRLRPLTPIADQSGTLVDRFAAIRSTRSRRRLMLAPETAPAVTSYRNTFRCTTQAFDEPPAASCDSLCPLPSHPKRDTPNPKGAHLVHDDSQNIHAAVHGVITTCGGVAIRFGDVSFTDFYCRTDEPIEASGIKDETNGSARSFPRSCRICKRRGRQRPRELCTSSLHYGARIRT